MFELLGYVVLGWIAYRLVSAWVTLQEIKSAVGEAVERRVIADEMTKQILVVRMEPVVQGDYSVVLAYNNQTNKFLGQDTTQEQVENMIKSKYPNMNIIVVSEKATIDTYPV